MFKIETLKGSTLEAIQNDLLNECIDSENNEQPYFYLEVEFPESDPRSKAEDELKIEVFFSNGEFDGEINLIENEWEYEIQFTDEELAYIKETIINANVFELSNLYKANHKSFKFNEDMSLDDMYNRKHYVYA